MENGFRVSAQCDSLETFARKMLGKTNKSEGKRAKKRNAQWPTVDREKKEEQISAHTFFVVGGYRARVVVILQYLL